MRELSGNRILTKILLILLTISLLLGCNPNVNTVGSYPQANITNENKYSVKALSNSTKIHWWRYFPNDLQVPVTQNQSGGDDLQ